MRSHKGTCFAATFNTIATPASIENVKMYLAIAVSTYINIVCE